jgi:ABC-type amino acid transport substrate-binding protein
MKQYRTVSIIISLLFVATLAACNVDTSDTSSSTSVMDQIVKRGSIRAGYISYPPSLIKDANTGKFSGIYFDVMQEASSRLGIPIEYVEEEDWATMTEAVRTGRVDMVVSGIWPTSARATQADFTVPLYFSSVRAYVRADDDRFDQNVAQINRKSVTIAAIDGEMSSIIATQDFPLAQTRSLPQSTQISQLLLELQTRKADVTFVEPAVASEYMSHNPKK